MQVDFLIVGQGICGSFLSHFLQENNCSFLVIDDGKKSTASKVASGVINPITGRRLVRTWMIEKVLPYVVNTYQQIEKKLNINFIKQLDIVDFFATPQMKLSFEERLPNETHYLEPIQNHHNSFEHFNNVFGAGLIKQSYLIDLSAFLEAMRNNLVQNNQLLEEYFDINDLIVNDESIQYKNITASKIIFCDGVDGTKNKYFNLLPYAPNKGEALIARIRDLPQTFMYKYGLSIIPWKEDLFWVGSTYEWNFDNDKPTESFREKTEKSLQQILKNSFTIEEHLCAVRPANIERRPFVGFHPKHENIGILNGMGTKGCSLAPYFANELVEYILHEKPINPLADVKRFERILNRDL